MRGLRGKTKKLVAWADLCRKQSHYRLHIELSEYECKDLKASRKN